MGLTKRKDGWYVEFRVIDDGKVLRLAPSVSGAKVKRWKTSTTVLTLAKKQEAIIKTDLMLEKYKSEKVARPITFREWGEKYLEMPEIKNLRSYRNHVERVRVLLTPYFGDKLLTDITADDIETYRAQRTLRPKNGKTVSRAPSLSTINGDQAILKQMLYLAVKKKLIVSNPASEVTMPKPQNERDRILTPEEWRKLYAEAAEHLKPILLTAYLLGQRFREIVDLTWDRVDLKRGMITLRAIDTKTKQPRQIPLTSELIQVFRDLHKIRYLGQDRVFLRNGQSIQSVRTAFENARARAGLNDFRFHDLRHCAATNLRRAGVDIVTAMAIVGHKSEEMFKRYNTVDEADLKEAAARLNTYITLAHQAPEHQSYNTSK